MCITIDHGLKKIDDNGHSMIDGYMWGEERIVKIVKSAKAFGSVKAICLVMEEQADSWNADACKLLMRHVRQPMCASYVHRFQQGMWKHP